MAYQYDELGNIIGEYESEKERKRRMDAAQANTPVKQTITTNPDGTQEMTIKGTPQALSPMNPNTPTVSGPVSPDTFRRMQQVESGNRDFDAQGRPITSPKGAMFRNQVMPATAANPGFGIRPAQSQTPEEYNRVGAEYYQAMLKKFGGDEQKAIAAYNAGPGAVERNVQANRGQMNVSQLPRETQGYLQKVGNVVGNMIPSAQAATPQSFAQDTANRRSQTQMVPGLNARDDLMMRSVSPAQSAAQAQMPQPDSVINNQVAAFEARQQPQALNLPDDPFQSYIKLQESPKDLINFAYDDTLPENLRSRAKERASEILIQEREMARAKNQIPAMSETDIARALREKTTGGSYIKAVLFGMLGMEQSAMAEAAKLGVGKEILSTINGEPAMIKMAANGTPIEGYNAKTGKRLSAQELITAAQFGTMQKGANIGGQVYRDPVTNETLTKVDTAQGPIYYNKAQQRVVPKGEPLPLTAGTDVSTQLQLAQMKRQQQFVGQTASARLKAFEDTNAERALAGYPLLSLQDMGLTATGELAGAAQPTAQGGAAAQPAQGAAQSTAQVPTGAALKSSREAQQTIVTDAAKQVAASADTQNMLGSIDKITNLLDSGKHNVGSVLSGFAGRGPVAQAIGGQFETEDAKNTKTILDTVNKLAADGLKALGSNPSTVDLEFWTKYKPDGGSDPAFVRDWIQSRSADLKRRLGYAGSQVSTGGQSGTAPAANAELSPQERARQELARRKKKD